MINEENRTGSSDVAPFGYPRIDRALSFGSGFISRPRSKDGLKPAENQICRVHRSMYVSASKSGPHQRPSSRPPVSIPWHTGRLTSSQHRPYDRLRVPSGGHSCLGESTTLPALGPPRLSIGILPKILRPQTAHRIPRPASGIALPLLARQRQSSRFRALPFFGVR